MLAVNIPSLVNIVVGTIHSFQGDQCNVVLAVFNPPKGLRRGAEQAHINNLNIINVAISRAQDYLCVFMPSRSCDGYLNLTELRRLGHISNKTLNEYTGIIQQQELETLLFGTPNYLDRNVFVTSHQIANVYTRPAAHYEVRCDEKSIDIQVDEINENNNIDIYEDDKKTSGGEKRRDSHSSDVPVTNEIVVKHDNVVDHTVNEAGTTRKVPSFGLTKLGIYSIGIVGNVEGFIHLIKKYGGYQSNKRMIYKNATYNSGYIIPAYNFERFLASLKDEGWDTSKLQIM